MYFIFPSYTLIMNYLLNLCSIIKIFLGRRDHMVIWFTTTYAISAYHHYREFEQRSGKVYSIQHYVTCDRSVVSSGTLVSSTNKTDCHHITEILLKVALNTICLALQNDLLIKCSIVKAFWFLSWEFMPSKILFICFVLCV
jgi:hypothetical protein